MPAMTPPARALLRLAMLAGAVSGTAACGRRPIAPPDGAADATDARDATTVGDAGDAPETGTGPGTIRLGWVLRHADGSSTDCLQVKTPDVEITVSTLGGTAVAMSDPYCVAMQANIENVPSGGYVVEVRLFDDSNVQVAYVATGAAVFPRAIADLGALVLMLSN
jgi:hypothetical protein